HARGHHLRRPVQAGGGVPADVAPAAPPARARSLSGRRVLPALAPARAGGEDERGERRRLADRAAGDRDPGQRRVGLHSDQPHFSPLKMEEQVCVIYAGVNGYLDPIPVSRVHAFEQGLLTTLRAQHADILDAIRTSRDLDDETSAKLKSAVDAYAKAFA